MRKKVKNFIQLSLFDDTEFSVQPNVEEVVVGNNKLNNSNVIKNISYDQKEILWNIMQLYNQGRPFDCDMTASKLKFYEYSKKAKYNIPEPSILMDVYPVRDDIIKITPFEPLPLEDNSLSSIIVDLPFVCSPKTCKSAIEKKKGSNMIANRFSSWYFPLSLESFHKIPIHK